MSLESIKERIHLACERASRQADEVQLVAVTKNHSSEEIKDVVLKHGHVHLGENRIQEWRNKFEELKLDELTENAVIWHMIGSLQRNKVKYCRPFSLIHSLNSERLADELNKHGEKHNHIFKCLVEVNVAAEESKLGASSEQAETLVNYASSLSFIEVQGLMTMAPPVEDAEEVRPVFRNLRELRDRLGLRELSMGMSGDFEIAIEEGATFVRVGSAIFK